MKSLGLSFVLFFLFCGLKAQTDYRPGYIITLSSDTIYGKIDYRGDYTMGNVCRFESNEGLKTEYAPGQIQAYRFIDSKYYVSKTVDNQTHFLEYLIKGKMNIYRFRDDIGYHYYVEKDDLSLKEIPYIEEQKNVDGKEYLYSSTTHIGLLNYATKDAPQLQQFINKMRNPNHNNLIKVAKDYHNAVCEDGEKCIVFERSTTFKVQAEPFVGYYFWLRQQDDFEKIGFTPGFFFGGAAIYASLPELNENWYFKTGVLYSQTEDVNLFIIPMQLAYVYPKGRVRPTFSGGANCWIIKEFKVGGFFPSYSVGFLTEFDRKTSFTFNLGLDTEPLVIGDFPIVFLPNYKIFGLMASVCIRHTF